MAIDPDDVCPICYERLQYPIMVCPGGAHEELRMWRSSSLPGATSLQESLPGATHRMHEACLRRWRLHAHGEHRRGTCPMCKVVIAGSAFVIHADGIVEQVHSSGSASLSSSMSRPGSEAGFSWSSASELGLEPGTPHDVERVWLQLVHTNAMRDVNVRHACCRSGTRAWILASELAAELRITGVTADVLAAELPNQSYSFMRRRRPLYRDFMRPHPLQPHPDFDRPVFEIYWDSRESEYYVSCLSIQGDNCRCGAEERDADVRFVPWSAEQASRVNARMKRWNTPGTHPWLSFPHEDAHAGPGEVLQPWLLAETVRSALDDDRELYVTDMTVHEFVRQCRHFCDWYQTPLFQVCSYVNHHGVWEYWVRTMNIGERRRWLLAQVPEEDLIEV